MDDAVYGESFGSFRTIIYTFQDHVSCCMNLKMLIQQRGWIIGLLVVRVPKPHWLCSTLSRLTSSIIDHSAPTDNHIFIWKCIEFIYLFFLLTVVFCKVKKGRVDELNVSYLFMQFYSYLYYFPNPPSQFTRITWQCLLPDDAELLQYKLTVLGSVELWSSGAEA